MRLVGGSSFIAGANVVATTGASELATALPDHQGEDLVREFLARISPPKASQ
jgi:hypothetical protein